MQLKIRDWHMDRQPKQSFHWRGFVSVVTSLSFLGLAITGIVLFFIPMGRIANRTNWQCLGLSRHQWNGLHIWFGLLFFWVALFHVCYNWKCLVSYFQDKTRRHLALRWEWGAAVLLIWVMSAGTVRGVIPFSSFLRWHTAIKHRQTTQPADVDTAIGPRPGQGRQVGNHESLGVTAHPTPLPEANSRGGGSGQGFGRMSLADYCEAMNLDPAEARSILEQAGMSVDVQMTLRAIANAGQVHPSDIRRLLER